MANLKNLVLVGYGGMGGCHIDQINSKKFFNVVGVYDIDPAKLEKAKQNNLKAYETLQEVLDDKSIEIILVATPNEVHLEIATKAMEAGKHVLCEKPACMDSKELAIIDNVMKKTGKIFTVNQNRRYDNDYLMVKDIIDKKTIGTILQLESRVHGSRGIPGDWRGLKKHGGGMMLDWGVHILDQATFFFPNVKIKSLYCKFTHITNDEVDDGFTAILNYDNGVTGIYEVGTSNFIVLPRFYVLGSHGSAEIGLWNDQGKIVRLDSTEKDVAPIRAGAGFTKTMAPRTSESVEELTLPKVEGDFNDMYRKFIDAINGKGQPVAQIPDLMRVMLLMEKCFESDIKNQVVTFE